MCSIDSSTLIDYFLEVLNFNWFMCNLAVSSPRSLMVKFFVGYQYRFFITEDRFTHKTERPWSLNFKHSRWWKRQSQLKFASHYAWGTNGVCECKMDVKPTWIPTRHQMDHVSWSLGLFSKAPLEGRPNTKLGDHDTPNAYNRRFILFYLAWGPHMHRNSLK